MPDSGETKKAKADSSESVNVKDMVTVGPLDKADVRFRTPEGAIFHTWRWTAFLIVNLCMANLLPGDELRPSISDAAQHICMSYYYAAGLKPLGAQFLQFPLIAIYSVSSEEVKHWILRKINLLVEEMHISFEREYLETMATLVLGGLD